MSNEFFEKLSRSSQYSFIKEFKVSEDVPLHEDDYEKLLITIETILDDKEFGFIGGTSILTSDGKQIILVARNDRIASDLHKSAEIIRDLDDVNVFFNSLPDKAEIGGLGHLEFEYFEMFFGNLHNGEFAIAFQVIDDKEQKVPLMNFHLEEVKNIFADIDFSAKSGLVIDNEKSTKTPLKQSPSKSPRPTFSSTPQPTISEKGNTSEPKKEETKVKSSKSTPSNVDPITGKPKKLMTREDYRISLSTRLKELED